MMSFLEFQCQVKTEANNEQCEKSTDTIMVKMEQTTERHQHKFKLGTRFINPGLPERYGRVVGGTENTTNCTTQKR
jgi:hypothetical protein